MPSYTHLRRAAYLQDPDASPWTASYHALPFPEHWHEGLLALCNVGRDEERRLRTVPTRRLDGVLQTLAPDLIVRPRSRPPLGERTTPPQDAWLYVPSEAPPPLPAPALSRLLDAWLPTLGPRDGGFGHKFRRLMLATSAELKKSLPTWHAVGEVKLLVTPASDGGTAVPEGRQFQLATDALARRILALDPYEFDGGTLRFRAVPRGPRDQGAELMSQPLCRTVKRREWWFSVVLNISLHTVPFDPQPRLHLHWSVRRWATHPRRDTGRLDLPFTQATSVHLRPNIPWLPGAPTSDRYAVARLVRDHRSGSFTWMHNDPAGILRALTLGDRFPAVDALLSDPVTWIDEGGPGVRAAVTHSNRMSATHEIGRGFMPHQRSQLTAWAEQALPEGVRRAPDLVRAARGAGAPANRRPKPKGDEAKQREGERTAHQRRAALAAVRSADGRRPEVEFRLLWQTHELRHQAVAAFADVLGLPERPQASNRSGLTDQTFDEARPGSSVDLEWHTPELLLRLRCLPLNGGLGERLELDDSIRGKGARIAEAITTRRRDVCTRLKEDGAAPEQPALALVEIAHRSAFRASGTDPKFALRLGCADAGVLTQFAATPTAERGARNEGSLEHRVRNAWLDGIRQLGVRVLPEHTRTEALPDDLRYAALWMVKRRKDGPTRLPLHQPVAVLMTPLPGAAGLARIQGWDDERGDWVPYPDFLLGLVKKAEVSADAFHEPTPRLPGPRSGEGSESSPVHVTSPAWRGNLEEQRRRTARFLQRLLHSLRGRPTVLITHAQNSRLHWPWLQDGRVIRDLLKDGHAPARRIDEQLRLVRVRGGSGRETAQWWGVAEGPDQASGQPAGFWSLPVQEGCRRTLGERVFYSATSRPQTQPVSPSLDRLAIRVNAQGTPTSQAGTDACNPALTEITVLACHPDDNSEDRQDDPLDFALAMHQLRQAPDYPDALSLPLPLHLAGQAQAYVLPMAEAEESEEADLEGRAHADGRTEGDLDPDLTEPPSPDAAPEPQLSLF
ncbi:pPIWI_RE module domain-containing protein [Streptomyces sp. GSL17-111]|uniref:pPIWI_RE module domain-containing protein n=1 Tax=Streptomyces sp. GSL17-111 TaxID=3121596 RepID=UPI0030F37CB3